MLATVVEVNWLRVCSANSHLPLAIHNCSEFNRYYMYPAQIKSTSALDFCSLSHCDIDHVFVYNNGYFGTILIMVATINRIIDT